MSFAFLSKRCMVRTGAHGGKCGIVVSELPPIRDGFIRVRVRLEDGTVTRPIACVAISLIDDKVALTGGRE